MASESLREHAIGRIRALATNKDIGVVGLNKSKTCLELEGKVNLKLFQKNETGMSRLITRDMEGITWVWINLPEETVLPKASLNEHQGYVKLMYVLTKA